MIRVLLDCIVIVAIICMMYIAMINKDPIFFLIGCIVGVFMGYLLKEDLENTSQ